MHKLRLAAAMKRDLTAWIKAERIARGLGAEIAQLPAGDWTSLVGPRFKDHIFRHAEAKDKARECEKKVRENEHGNYELPALFLSGPLDETIKLDPRRQDLLELSVLKG